MRSAFVVMCSLLVAACGDSGSSTTHKDGGVADMTMSADAGASQAGMACADDTACANANLACDTSVAGGFCTGSCTQSNSQSNEQGQCGGVGSTCLAIGDGSSAQTMCTHACNPKSKTSCRGGEVCTGWWFTHASGKPDSPGCFPFCQTDAQCPSGQKCNNRTGECGTTGLDMTKLADGSPCDVPSGNAASPCRGLCFITSSTDMKHGICGSFIDLSVAQQCPDNPDTLNPLAPQSGDNLAICIFQNCTTGCECPQGLVCNDTGTGQGVCDYAPAPDAGTVIECSGDGGAPTDGGTNG